MVHKENLIVTGSRPRGTVCAGFYNRLMTNKSRQRSLYVSYIIIVDKKASLAAGQLIDYIHYAQRQRGLYTIY